ncbi:MAG: glyoxalase/bleomycin resistance/extradiol dioxygenase family protein [Flavobacteriales bacterium]|nr:glyoxalase/bleomycin resistance/extradiol dioxygenase family protein [Flavobacteriales bacterium]
MGLTKINPYLYFEGNAKEAMEFYKDALGGELEIKLYDDAPMDVPEEMKEKVIHATLDFGDATLMASDAQPGQLISFGSANSISILESDIDKATNIFNKLSDEGTVTMPFEIQFWGAKFGTFIDKFGIYWMVNCQVEK